MRLTAGPPYTTTLNLTLLGLGEVTAAAVPSWAQEADRDLVRVREDVRADLVSRETRSELLLRQGEPL